LQFSHQQIDLPKPVEQLRRLANLYNHPHKQPPIMDSAALEITTQSVEETRQLGAQFGQWLHPGLLIALNGELGAGKTALTQGIAAGLGVSERVTSPTFTLINRYATPAGFDLVHIDCYRLGEERTEALRQASTIGIEEIVDEPETVVVIEWAERVADLLPPDHLAITLTQVDQNEHHRRLTIYAHGPKSAAFLAAVAA
jgi:tRNA threonylcarbamoyladenosine biosynthesis protein TsaE